MPGQGSWIDICYKPFWNDGLEFAIAPAAIKYLHKSLDIPWNNFGWKLSVGGGVQKFVNKPNSKLPVTQLLPLRGEQIRQTAIENNGKKDFL